MIHAYNTSLAYKTLICDLVNNYSAIRVQFIKESYKIDNCNNNLSQNTVSIAGGHHDAFIMLCKMNDR